MKPETKSSDVKALERDMKFYLATAKINKGVSLAIYYAGLLTAMGGVGYAFTRDTFASGFETAGAGAIMGAMMVGCAAVIRQMNPRILRDYVETRDMLNQVKDLQKQK